MPKADVLAFIASIGGVEAQSPQISNYYGDVAADLAHRGIFSALQLVPAVKDQAEYALDPTSVEILGVFYDDEFLSHAILKELEARDPQWRDTVGRPICYNTEQVEKGSIRLYPAPNADAGPQIFIHGAPFGLDYPVGTIFVMVSDIRVDYPTWIDLPYALAVMALEFTRDSDHANKGFADACVALGALMMQMVGET